MPESNSVAGAIRGKDERGATQAILVRRQQVQRAKFNRINQFLDSKSPMSTGPPTCPEPVAMPGTP